MDSSPEVTPHISGPVRYDTMSTISSDKQPLLPSGRWCITLHGNCSRCGHHHKAAVIQINVAEGVCQASHVKCDRCNQKWLTIGGVNTTQISLLSSVTADPDFEELNFRSTLFSIVRSAASVASPAALANVPEDSSRVPSRSSSIRSLHGTAVDVSSPQLGSPSSKDANSPFDPSNDRTMPERLPNDIAIRNPKLLRSSRSKLFNLKHKLGTTIDMLKKVSLKGFISRSKKEKAKTAAKGEGKLPIIEQLGSQEPPTLQKNVAFETPRELQTQNCGPSDNAEDVCCNSAKTAARAVEDLKSFDREAIRNMAPNQCKDWIREQITAFKHRRSHHCNCKRRHSASSISDHSSVLFLPTAQAIRRHSLEQMGSQFDSLPLGSLFTHTGPLTISATRISEADTAVENQPHSSSPRQSLLDFAQRQAHRSRSPRPASLALSRHSRNSRQYLRSSRAQRDSMDSVLAGSTVRNSWRGVDRLSAMSLSPQTMLASSDSLEQTRSPDHVDREGISSITPQEDNATP
ncbi:hypothetical protein N0V90_011650 [Kalmusia sp. IMI 367209]|nr:hypothetical protein N0V90_011650 [Kalmusia sp. IMI 367209]